MKTVELYARVRHAVRHCQTNPSEPGKGAGLRRSGRQLTPLGQGRRTVLFEDIATVEVTVVVEVIVDRGMGSGKLLEGGSLAEVRLAVRHVC
jgi:hypothetical protein